MDCSRDAGGASSGWSGAGSAFAPVGSVSLLVVSGFVMLVMLSSLFVSASAGWEGCWSSDCGDEMVSRLFRTSI